MPSSVNVPAASTAQMISHESGWVCSATGAVPPATKHAWKPDEGSTLVAIQLYTPPGPEQRFKALAAAAADAGAKK